MLVTKDGYEIDDDPARLDLDVVHGFVTGSYWAEGVPRDVVARSVANSLNLGLYHGGSQVGFTRAVTDRATFAWVCDVFVLPGHQGRGLGHWMIETLRAHPDLAGLRRFLLAEGLVGSTSGPTSRGPLRSRPRSARRRASHGAGTGPC